LGKIFWELSGVNGAKVLLRFCGSDIAALFGNDFELSFFRGSKSKKLLRTNKFDRLAAAHIL
jgi:hypothetical protein